MLMTTTHTSWPQETNTTATYITSAASSHFISQLKVDALPSSTAHDARDNAHRPPLGPLEDNILPSVAVKLKTKKTLPRLPHPLSINVLPSPINKWSTTSHPTQGFVMGYKRLTISYRHFSFQNDRVLQMKAFAIRTTATTVGNGGKPRGSTELYAITGHNCAMTKEEYTTFAIIVLGARQGATHGNRPSEGFFVNLLLCDYVCLTNLTAIF